jgi:hypothetical protein
LRGLFVLVALIQRGESAKPHFSRPARGANASSGAGMNGHSACIGALRLMPV